MNTMYRNNFIDYGRVKDKFVTASPSILSKENVPSESAFDKVMNTLACRCDNDIKAAFEKDVEQITGLWPYDRDKITGTSFDKMPKALLHVHSTVGLSVDDLGELIINWNNSENEELGGRPEGAPQIVYCNMSKIPANGKTEVLMYNAEYIVDGEIIKPSTETGQEIKPICEQTQWDEIKEELYLKNADKDNWNEFNRIFAKIDALFWHKDFYYCYHKKFFEKCKENNIQYIELRTGFQEFVSDWKIPEHVTNSITLLQPGFMMEDFFYHRERMTSVTPNNPDTLFLQKIYNAAVGSGFGNNNVKVILTANRNKKDSIGEDEFYKGICLKADAAIAIRNRISIEPDINIPEIAGFDLVNQELSSLGTTDKFAEKILYSEFGTYNKNKLKYYFKSELDALTKIDGISRSRINLIRYFFHDGESVESIDSPNDNGITGPICSRYRIGHGFKMGTEGNFDIPESIKGIKSVDQERNAGHGIADYILYGESDDAERGKYPVEKSGKGYTRKDIIPEPVLELCPISNYMLGYVEDLNTHPTKKLMETGIFAVICSDDPQIFNNPGLSYDYAIMYKCLYNEKEKDEDKKKEKDRVFKQIKLSSFLGFYYKEMSEYYYIKQSIDGRDVYFARDNMEIGDKSNSPVRENETDSNKITEWSVFNKAVQRFKNEWEEFGRSITHDHA